MGWERFRGNAAIVASVRRMISNRRLPHSLVLAGPPGVGKYTMGTMVARTVNCLDEAAYSRSDFCGQCWNCKTIAELEAYEDHPKFGKILAERPRLSLEERKDNPLLLSTHPDIFVLPPDGKIQQISIHQVRRMIALAQYRPSRARQRVFILDNADRTDEVAASAMLKILEEPPADTLLLLTAVSYFQLLPTLRSRAFSLHLAPLDAEEVERLLEALPWSPAEKRLAARLSEGSPGIACRMDLEESRRLRGELLALLRYGFERRNFGDLFTRTQSLAQAREEKLENLLGLFYSLLHDVLYLVVSRETGAPSRPLRNLDLEKELVGIARQADWEWIRRATARLDRLDRLLRRNINRQVALEALAVSLSRARTGLRAAAPLLVPLARRWPL